MTILTRAAKGQSLTDEELDNNWTELRDRPQGQVYPKTKGVGVKLNTPSPDWGWKDLIGHADFELSLSPPSPQVYQGGISAYQYSVGDYLVWTYHIPHDYAPNTDLFIHPHWSHNSSTVTSGHIVMQYECMYAKGHNQGAFGTYLTTSDVQNASNVRYQHMVNEDHLSKPAGADGHLPTELIEVDGLVIVHAKLLECTINGGVLPFIHCVDIHYQSTNLPTFGRAPDFYA